MIEPIAVVHHPANKCLLWFSILGAMAIDAAGVSGTRSHLRRAPFGVVRSTRGAAAVLASQIARYCEGYLVHEFCGIVIYLDLRAVVGMDTRATRLANHIFTEPVVVPYKVQVGLGAPENLPSQPRLAV